MYLPSTENNINTHENIKHKYNIQHIENILKKNKKSENIILNWLLLLCDFYAAIQKRDYDV